MSIENGGEFDFSHAPLATPTLPLSASQPPKIGPVPLTVTAVAERLGISPSTVRTWERRYGMGPRRRAGAHRRYFADDIMRLTRMVELVRSGVAPSDAAATVRELSARDLAAAAPAAPPSSPDQLLDAVQRDDFAEVARLVEASVATHGLIHTYTDFVEPVTEMLRNDPAGETPGGASSLMLTAIVLRVLRALAPHAGKVCHSDEGGPRDRDGKTHMHDAANDAVARDHDSARSAGMNAQSAWCHHRLVIMADPANFIAAHMVGVDVQWRGLPTSILLTGLSDAASAVRQFERHRRELGCSVVIVMGKGSGAQELIEQLTRIDDLHIVLVGERAPHIVDARIQRVRTLSACVDETVALMRELCRTP